MSNPEEESESGSPKAKKRKLDAKQKIACPKDYFCERNCHYKITTQDSKDTEVETHYDKNDKVVHTIPLYNGLRHGVMIIKTRMFTCVESYEEGDKHGIFIDYLLPDDRMDGYVSKIRYYCRGLREGIGYEDDILSNFDGGQPHGMLDRSKEIRFYGERRRDLSKFRQQAAEIRGSLDRPLTNIHPLVNIVLYYVTPLDAEVYKVMGLDSESVAIEIENMRIYWENYVKNL